MRGAVVQIQIDQSRCVLCGGPNDCVMARARADRAEAETGEAESQANERCWCVDAVFPESLRTEATARDKGASCICRTCLDR